jgi:hypothetical protein
MEWKQPEGFRHRWVVEEIDAELMFLQTPFGRAYGRVGDEDYVLDSSGILSQRRTLRTGDGRVAIMNCGKGGVGGATVSWRDRTYCWAPASLLETRWVLWRPDGADLFTFVEKVALSQSCRIRFEETSVDPSENALLVLCWYDRVLPKVTEAVDTKTHKSLAI